MKIIFAPVMVGAVAALMVSNGVAVGTSTLQDEARAAISQDTARSATAIAALRAAGPAGLDALFEIRAASLKQRAKALSSDDALAESLRVNAALDAVGQQHDCYASHLYWFTNFDEAKAAAKANGKPILSLRMLGKLDEEFSCANSRFFRTTLYANSEISDYLRRHFILHWKSVRPVPRITIDFGDGRKLERTITGNSIHYILDSEGRVIDALPGLYGPRAFLTGLQKAEAQALASAPESGPARATSLRAYHLAEDQKLQAAFVRDLAVVNSGAATAPSGSVNSFPSAKTAAAVALTKLKVEKPMLNSALPPSPQPPNPGAMPEVNDSTWRRIAALHSQEATLDQKARELIRGKNPSAWDAAQITTSKIYTENPFLRMLRNLERSIAEDTVRNEYLFHTTIHQWLADTDAATEIDRLNAKIYSQLFLTPDSDPWLGLVQTDAFSALDHDGLITKTLN